MNLQVVEKGMDLVDLAQYRGQVRAVMYLRVPYSVENFLTSSENVRFSRWTLLCAVICLVGWLIN
jgi:hypothetical protein